MYLALNLEFAVLIIVEICATNSSAFHWETFMQYTKYNKFWKKNKRRYNFYFGK